MEYLGLAGLLIVLATLARWMQRAWATDIPKSFAPFQAAAALGALLGVAALLQNSEAAYARPAIGFGLVFLYLSFTGAQRSGNEAIAVGDTIPSFTATQDDGASFDSANLDGSRVLLKFFRGHW